MEPDKNSLWSSTLAGCLLKFVHVVLNGIWDKFAKIIHIYLCLIIYYNFWIKKKKSKQIQTHTYFTYTATIHLRMTRLF